MFLLGHGARVRSSGQQQAGRLVVFGRVGDVSQFVEVVPVGVGMEGRMLMSSAQLPYRTTYSYLSRSGSSFDHLL